MRCLEAIVFSLIFQNMTSYDLEWSYLREI